MDKFNDYKASLTINANKIDKEILEQPQKYYDWSIALAEAEIYRDEVKENLEVLSAALENELKSNIEFYFGKGSKPTESSIKARIMIDEDIIKARKELLDANAICKLLKKAELAFDQRAKMLESYQYYLSRRADLEKKDNRSSYIPTSQRIKRFTS